MAASCSSKDTLVHICFLPRLWRSASRLPSTLGFVSSPVIDVRFGSTAVTDACGRVCSSPSWRIALRCENMTRLGLAFLPRWPWCLSRVATRSAAVRARTRDPPHSVRLLVLSLTGVTLSFGHRSARCSCVFCQLLVSALRPSCGASAARTLAISGRGDRFVTGRVLLPAPPA